MKVLFIRSANNGPSPITQNQGDSLINLGIDVSYFDIRKKGILGYLSYLPKLKIQIKEHNPDLIHAHYSLCGFIAGLTFTKKSIVTSLMGSDVNKANFIYLALLRFFIKYLWNDTIVKTFEMKSKLSIDSIHIIPNGINLKVFRIIDKKDACEELQWESNYLHVLFGSDPQRPEKNFKLAREAFNILKNDFQRIKLYALTGIDRDEVYLYYNAADVTILTSYYEGSPNVVKEAMACNCPIVATDVGDIKWVVGQTESCYITSFGPKDVAEKIQIALDFNKRTQGRNRILELGLDSETIAKRIIDVYHEVISKQKKKGKY